MTDSDEEFGWDAGIEEEIDSQAVVDNDSDEYGWTKSAEVSLIEKSRPSETSSLACLQTSFAGVAPTATPSKPSAFAVETPVIDLTESDESPQEGAVQRRERHPVTPLTKVVSANVGSLTKARKEVPKSDPPGWSYIRHPSKDHFWNHLCYRSPTGEAVRVHYCKTRAQCEAAARIFLKEPAVGFDMEWKAGQCRRGAACKRRNCHGLQQKISMIQIANGSDIALFHVAMLEGATVAALVVPTLRKVIEDEKILKAGVSVYKADGTRLMRYFKLSPRGLIELSEFHRLVTFWGKDFPEAVSKKMISLSNLTRIHLGKPLDKTHSVRASNWSKPLSTQQIEYAANDAYVGFQLYRWLELKRRKMKIMAPHPLCAELRRHIRPQDYGFNVGKENVEARALQSVAAAQVSTATQEQEKAKEQIRNEQATPSKKFRPPTPLES